MCKVEELTQDVHRKGENIWAKLKRKNPVSLEKAYQGRMLKNVKELSEQSWEMRDNIYYRLVLSVFTSFFLYLWLPIYCSKL